MKPFSAQASLHPPDRLFAFFFLVVPSQPILDSSFLFSVENHCFLYSFAVFIFFLYFSKGVFCINFVPVRLKQETVQILFSSIWMLKALASKIQTNFSHFDCRGSQLCGLTCYIIKKTGSENLHQEASVARVRWSCCTPAKKLVSVYLAIPHWSDHL